MDRLPELTRTLPTPRVRTDAAAPNTSNRPKFPDPKAAASARGAEVDREEESSSTRLAERQDRDERSVDERRETSQSREQREARTERSEKADRSRRDQRTRDAAREDGVDRTESAEQPSNTEDTADAEVSPTAREASVTTTVSSSATTKSTTGDVDGAVAKGSNGTTNTTTRAATTGTRAVETAEAGLSAADVAAALQIAKNAQQRATNAAADVAHATTNSSSTTQDHTSTAAIDAMRSASTEGMATSLGDVATEGSDAAELVASTVAHAGSEDRVGSRTSEVRADTQGTGVHATGSAARDAHPAHATVANPTEAPRMATTEAPRAPEPPVPMHDVERAADILRQVRVHITPRVEEAHIQLHPAELGRMSIQISIEDGRMKTTVRAEKREALDAIEAHLPELRAALRDAGIQSQEFQLSLGLDSRSRRDGDDRTGSTTANGGRTNGVNETDPTQLLRATAKAVGAGAVDLYA